MLHRSLRHCVFARLGRTKLGAEVLAKTRVEMRDMDHSSSRLMRFLMRRRPIDYLALEVDNSMTRELHPSFRVVKHTCTFVLMVPLFVLLVSGVLSPSYYLLVPTGFVTVEQFDRMWDFSHWAVVLSGQILLFLVLYDLSVYVRYPLFAYVLAPLYRKLGLRRKQQTLASMTLDELRLLGKKRGLPRHAKPLGVPLNEVKRAAQQVQRPDPFGARPRSK